MEKEVLIENPDEQVKRMFNKNVFSYDGNWCMWIPESKYGDLVVNVENGELVTHLKGA
jgi:hypothetical protein